MGFKFKRLTKSAKKIIKSAGRTAAKVVKVAAPVAGTLLLGPLGGLAGTALAAGASQVGPNKSRSAALKRSIVSGLGITAGGSALGLISGAGLGASGISSISRIFGGGSPSPQVAPDQNSALANAFLSPAGGTAAVVGGNPPAMQNGLENALFSGIGGFIGNQSGPSGLEGVGQRTGGTFGTEGGGLPGGGNSPYETEKPGIPWLPLVVAGGALLLLLKGKK